MSPTDIPHLITMPGTQILVLFRERPHLCLRCKQLGHIRRDCNDPLWKRCRRFGHDALVCPRAYASAVAGADIVEEHMDEGLEVGQLP